MESNLNAAKSAFLPDDEKQSLVDYLTKEYKKFHISKFWCLIYMNFLPRNLTSANKLRFLSKSIYLFLFYYHD